MVKNVVKKMHGLNKRQYVDFDSYFNSGIEGGSQQASFAHISPDSPNNLEALVDTLVTNSLSQTYIKRCTAHATLYNVGTLPVHVKVLYVRVRRDVAASAGLDHSTALANILNFNASPSVSYYNMPFVSNTSSDEFQKTFKMLRSTNRFLRPGRKMDITVKRKFGNRVLNWVTDADNNQWYWRKGNRIAIWWIHGFPVSPFNAPTESPGVLTGYHLTSMLKWYVSYYNMNDVSADSVVKLVVPATRPDVMQGFIAQPEVIVSNVGATGVDYVNTGTA